MYRFGFYFQEITRRSFEKTFMFSANVLGMDVMMLDHLKFSSILAIWKARLGGNFGFYMYAKHPRATCNLMFLLSLEMGY